MQADRHESIRHIIDKSLVGGASVEEEQSLREHLHSCTPCREYLHACNRTIASLGGFSFDVDPALDRRVLASLASRAQQLELERTHRKQLWVSRLIGITLAVVGSFAASYFGGLAAAVFHIDPAQMRLGFAAFWIAPSLCCCLLLLLLPMSPGGWTHAKGSSL